MLIKFDDKAGLVNISMVMMVYGNDRCAHYRDCFKSVL